MSESSVSRRLAAYRAHKASERQRQERKARVWDWITLKGIRNRLSGGRDPPQNTVSK